MAFQLDADSARLLVHGHAALVAAGVARLDVNLRFSFEMSAKHVIWFYRASMLNREFDDFAIPVDMMLEVIDAIGLLRDASFSYFP